MPENKEEMPVPLNPIEEVRMESAENGVIICYTEKRKRPGAGEYDNYSYEYKKEVFDFDEDKDSDKAFERFKQLFLAANKKKKS